MEFSFLLQSAPSSLLGLAPIVLIFGIFYFLLILPMQKQKKEQRRMLSELKAGDNVITAGGIVGTITALDAETLVLRVKPDNLKLQFARNAVSSVVVAPDASK